MRILFFEIMPKEQEMLLPHIPPGHEVVFLEEKLTSANAHAADGADIISIFVQSEIRAPLIDQLTACKLITTRSMGFDHIDVEYARTKGIVVGNVQTYASHPVAEFTYALMLSVIRKIYPAYNQLREGTHFDIRGLGGFNLFGKTLGVAGTGRIGKNVITIARGFGMEVCAYDVFPDEAFAKAQQCTYVPLEELLQRSDIISIHTPYNKDTHHLISTAQFAMMKRGVVLINTARGEMIDTIALIAALRDGTVAGVGLDVLEEERNLHEESEAVATAKPGVNYELLTANHILIDLPNVIITPHIAFETREALQEISKVTGETISNFIAGTEQKYL